MGNGPGEPYRGATSMTRRKDGFGHGLLVDYMGVALFASAICGIWWLLLWLLRQQA